jgi:threonine-phosphate decarboxylase
MNHGGHIFETARRHGWDWREIADFSASINPLGPSPGVRPAVEEAMERMVHYPEAYACGLQQALSEHWQIDPAGILLGNGATELLHFFARMLRPERVYLAAPVFSEFHRAFPDARIVPFEPVDWPVDGVLVVTRPANPTGRMPDLSGVIMPLIVDESFIEFTGETPSPTGRENLYVLRSLTKFHAIPGLRAGALLGPPAVLQQWKKKREPWQLNVLAEAAVRASLADDEHARRTVEFVGREREWLTQMLRRIPGLSPQPSVANFMLVALAQPALPLIGRLEREHKILVRDCSGWPGVPFAHSMRVAVRTRVENERLIAALRGILCDS